MAVKKKRKKEDTPAEPSVLRTVKMCLARHTREECILPLVEQYVCNSSMLVRRGSLLVNDYVLQRLASGETVPEAWLGDQMFFYNFFAAKFDGRPGTAYPEVAPFVASRAAFYDTTIPRLRADTGILNAAARDYAVNVGVYLETTFHSRIKQLVRKTFPSPSGAKVVRALTYRLHDAVLFNIFKCRPPKCGAPLPVVKLRDEHWEFIDRYRALLADAGDETQRPPWWPARNLSRTLTFQYRVLVALELLADGVDGVYIKRYNLLPVMHQRRHFIAIDAACLRHMMIASGLLSPSVKQDVFNSLADDHRRSVFRVRPSWRLGNGVHTDGVSVCFQTSRDERTTDPEFLKKKLRRDLADAKATKRVRLANPVAPERHASCSSTCGCGAAERHSVQPETRRVLANDPGRKNIACVVEVVAGERKHFRLTRDQFYAESHADKNIARRHSWRREFDRVHPGASEHLASVTSKTASRDRFDTFLLAELLHGAARWGEVLRRRTSLIVMDSYIHRRRVLDRFWLRHLGTDGSALVGWGDGKFKAGGKGERSIPKADTRASAARYAELREVDEWRTTKMCCDCGQELVPVRRTKNGRWITVRGVRRCTSNACSATPLKSRDYAAAYNIYKCLVEPERPVYLRRPQAAQD